MDEAIHGLLDPHHGYGHPDLAGYLPWMGARYSRIGADLPLSVFRGEGMVLFALARLLQPQVIAECYTGTGYAALAEAVLKQAFADSPTRCRSETCEQCMEQECSLKWLMQESTALTLWCHVAGISSSTVTMIARIQREKLHA